MKVNFIKVYEINYICCEIFIEKFILSCLLNKRSIVNRLSTNCILLYCNLYVDGLSDLCCHFQ